MSSSQLFDADAVSANRHGQLTRDQRQAYVGVTTGGRGGWLAVALAGVMLVVVVLEFGKQLADLQGAAQIISYGVVLAIFVIAALFVNSLYAIPARHRAAVAQVERREGRVTFEYGHYLPTVDGKLMRSIFFDETNLLPGSYTFYCIKGTNWLLSLEKQGDAESGSAGLPELDPRIVERLPESMRARAAQFIEMQAAATQNERQFDLGELRAALAATFGFDAAALEANRRGKLAPSQRDSLRLNLSSNFLWGFVLAVIGIGAIVLIVLKTKPVDPGGVAAVALFFGVISAYKFFQWSRENADMRRGVVKMTEGSIHKFTRTTNGQSGSTTTYYYGVNDLRFEVPLSAYNALIEHLNYRVYYVPVSKRIMSIEPVDASGVRKQSDVSAARR